MTRAVILSAVRTPIGRYGGALAGHRPDDLAALVVGEAVARAGVDPTDIDEVVFGAANQAGEDNRNIARMAALLAGLPDASPGSRFNRLCASGLTAVATARALIAAGEADLVVSGGVESMTRAPWVTEKPDRPWAKPGASFDTSIGWRFPNPRFDPSTTLSMPQTAEQVAQRWNLTRAELDEFALQSHPHAVKAIENGHFAGEIVPVGNFDTPTRTAARHQPRAPRGPPAGQRPGRDRHRRQLQLAQRWCRCDGDRQRGVCRPARAPASGADHGLRVVRSCPRDHGDRPGAGHPQSAGSRRLVNLRPRRGRAERGIRIAGGRGRAEPEPTMTP